MSASINKVILVGNVGRDPEIRSTQTGKEIASFSIATSESWKDAATGERKEKTEWHKISVFNEGLVGVIKNYVKKGSKVYLEGKLVTNKWTDNNGQERYTTEVVIQGYNGNLTMLDSRNMSGEQGSNYSANQGNSASNTKSNDFKFDSSPLGATSAQNNTSFVHEDVEDDEIPF